MKLFLDLHTVLAPSGEERTLGASPPYNVSTGQTIPNCEQEGH